jgi:methylated-DNA-[protein]-cysteine S-methyltransferase
VRAQFTQYAVPGWGVGELWTSGDLLLAHEFRFGLVREREADSDLELVARFRSFFAGEEVDFGDVAVDLESATAFQRAATDAIRAVPRGEVVSYGELAALAGFTGAGRAVGTVCARNRFMLVVPCHRIVGSDGLGGYGAAGLETKRRLLALEGVAA